MKFVQISDFDEIAVKKGGSQWKADHPDGSSATDYPGRSTNGSRNPIICHDVMKKAPIWVSFYIRFISIYTCKHVLYNCKVFTENC